jgi:hypothetical protein
MPAHAALLDLESPVTSVLLLVSDRHLPGQPDQACAEGERVKSFFGIERGVRLKLDRLESADVLKDLAALPGNRF